MFRRQVSPLTAAIATLVILAAIQFFYWRALVYQRIEPPGGGPGGGGGAAFEPVAVGREDVVVETLAGAGPGFADGPGWQARFSGPAAIAVARDGAIYVADSRNHRIRRVTPEGMVTTVAGGAEPGGEGGRSDGPAGSVLLRYPGGVAVRPDGGVLIADTGNHRICLLQQGPVRTLCGGRSGTADGTGAAAAFRAPGPLHVDPSGLLWVNDAGRARAVDASGTVRTREPPADVRRALGLEPAGTGPIHASADGRGDEEETVFRVGSRGPAVVREGAATIVPDPVYDTLLADRPGAPVLLIAGRRSGADVIMGGTDAAGNRATFSMPVAAVSLPGGTVYVAEYEGNRIRRIRLPDWIQRGEAAPARGRGPRWRIERGR